MEESPATASPVVPATPWMNVHGIDDECDLRALGLSHINWAKVTSTPWQGDLEESHINGRKSHQYVRITMAQLQ